MRELFQIERKKLWRSTSFWMALIFGIVMTGMSALYFIEGAMQGGDMRDYGAINPHYHACGTLYNNWIGGEFYSFGFSLFYFLFPVLCVLPYGWSLASELQSGYIKNIVVRTDRKKYFRAKYWTVFMGGSIAGSIPLIGNFVAVAMFLPALKPDLSYPYYNGLVQVDFMADLFCTHPLVFNLFFLLLGMIYFGLVAGGAWCTAFFVRNKALALILPVGVLLLLHYFSGMVSYEICKTDLSPLYCIHPLPVRYHTSGWVLLFYALVMVLIPLVISKIKGNSAYEIY